MRTIRIGKTWLTSCSLSVRNGPGSAPHHFAIARRRRACTRLWLMLHRIRGTPTRLLARHRDLERELVHHLMPGVGDDEGVAEENPKHAVGGNRIWLRHDDHAGLEDHVA